MLADLNLDWALKVSPPPHSGANGGNVGSGLVPKMGLDIIFLLLINLKYFNSFYFLYMRGPGVNIASRKKSSFGNMFCKF